MDEIVKDYICQTSCKIVVNKLQKVLTCVICWQMDEMPHQHFVHHIGMCVGMWCGDKLQKNYGWEHGVCQKTNHSHI